MFYQSIHGDGDGDDGDDSIDVMDARGGDRNIG